MKDDSSVTGTPVDQRSLFGTEGRPAKEEQFVRVPESVTEQSLPQAKAQLEHDIRAYAYAVEAGDVLAASINISNAIDALIAAVRNESALSRGLRP